jgi:N-acylglucosamine 2-epimerase
VAARRNHHRHAAGVSTHRRFEKYAAWHQAVHDWSFKHFADPQHGEWYGYLHRDGRVSSRLKGNTYKGAFHVPRMELICWQLMEEIKASHR